jgi:hypothetical protein
MPPDRAGGSVLVSLNDILEFAGMAFEVAVLGLLLYRRAWRTLPFFCIFCIWQFTSDIGDYVILHYFPSRYLTAYLVDTIITSTLQFCVLVEVAWSVFRPFRSSLPRHTVLVLGILVAAAGAAIWLFVGSSAIVHIHAPLEWRLLLHLKQTVTILRIVFFLLLASFSHLLSIGWRDRELQVTTGLGFYSLAALTVSVLQSQQGIGAHYRQLDQLVVATYICSLLYWIFCFAQKEAERREFSPQMQGLLLAVAGSARSTRVALAGSERKGGQP